MTRAGGCLLITADHGNAEMMRDPATGQPHTAHTTNPGAGGAGQSARRASPNCATGRLADIAPTLLSLLGIDPPRAMTGQPLLRAAARATA